MSVLLHRCLDCRHPVDWHDPRNRGYTSCGCCRDGRAAPEDEPVLQETFTSPAGRTEPLYAPGTPRNTGTMHATRTCDCERCRAAFAARQ